MVDDEALSSKKKDTPRLYKRPKLSIPRRVPSEEVPVKKRVFITPDKTTCEHCGCFPREDPYVKPKRLIQCQKSPLTLYELAAKVVDDLVYPNPFAWSEEDVVQWLSDVVGLPQYKDCVLDNHVSGMRLLMFEDPSHLPQVNIHDFEHILRITKAVRCLFSTEVVKFARSIGLPPRKPLTHTTWFKSRTGPSWGIRKNWTRCDVLRWMKIIKPEPVVRDHWDMVWYRKPEFPKDMFARVKVPRSVMLIPHYKYTEDVCLEYLVPRKFRFQTGIPEEAQMIWMQRVPSPPPKEKKKPKVTLPKETRLLPKKVNVSGLRGVDLVLARRKMSKPKFFL